VWADRVGVAAQVLGTFGGACLLYGSFGAIVGVFYQSTRRDGLA
jgi:hypothetical protein